MLSKQTGASSSSSSSSSKEIKNESISIRETISDYVKSQKKPGDDNSSKDVSVSLIQHLHGNTYAVGIQQIRYESNNGRVVKCARELESVCYAQRLHIFEIQKNAKGQSIVKEKKSNQNLLSLPAEKKVINIGSYFAFSSGHTLHFYKLNLTPEPGLTLVCAKDIPLPPKDTVHIYPISHSNLFIVHITHSEDRPSSENSIESLKLYQFNHFNFQEIATICDRQTFSPPMGWSEENRYNHCQPLITPEGQVILHRIQPPITEEKSAESRRIYIFDLKIKKGYFGPHELIYRYDEDVPQAVAETFRAEIASSYWHQASIILALEDATLPLFLFNLLSLVASYAVDDISFFPQRDAPKNHPEVREILADIIKLKEDLLKEKVDATNEKQKHDLLNACHFLQRNISYAGDKTYADIFDEAHTKFPILNHPYKGSLSTLHDRLLTILGRVAKLDVKTYGDTGIAAWQAQHSSRIASQYTLALIARTHSESPKKESKEILTIEHTKGRPK